MNFARAMFFIVLLSLAPPAFAQDAFDLPQTYIVECMAGKEFEVTVNPQDTMLFNYEGRSYELKIDDFCKTATKEKTPGVTGQATVMTITKTVDLDENGISDVQVSHTNCVTGRGTVTIRTIPVDSFNNNSTNTEGTFLTMAWVAMLLTLVVCILAISYITAMVFKKRRRE